MAKGGLAIILGAPKPKKGMGPPKEESSGDEGMYDMAGKELLAAIKAEDPRTIAEIVADICRLAKGDDY